MEGGDGEKRVMHARSSALWGVTARDGCREADTQGNEHGNGGQENEVTVRFDVRKGTFEFVGGTVEEFMRPLPKGTRVRLELHGATPEDRASLIEWLQNLGIKVVDED